jgi:hypothetical protein
MLARSADTPYGCVIEFELLEFELLEFELFIFEIDFCVGGFG